MRSVTSASTATKAAPGPTEKKLVAQRTTTAGYRTRGELRGNQNFGRPTLITYLTHCLISTQAESHMWEVFRGAAAGRRSRRDDGGSRGRRADEADARRGPGPGSAAPEGLATGAAPGTAAVQEDFGEAGPCCHQICKEGAARDGAAREDALDAACPCPDAASTVEVPSVPATTQSTRCCPCDCVSTRLTGLCPHRRRRKRPRRPRRV